MCDMAQEQYRAIYCPFLARDTPCSIQLQGAAAAGAAEDDALALPGKGCEQFILIDLSLSFYGARSCALRRDAEALRLNFIHCLGFFRKVGAKGEEVGVLDSSRDVLLQPPSPLPNDARRRLRQSGR